jgi:plastocyanin
MKKSISYFALLIVSGLLFSACIPGLNKEAAVKENGEVMIKDTTEKTGDVMVDETSDGMEKTDDAMMKEEGRKISMEMGEFYYAPNVIEAEAGETLTVTVENVGGFHDFVIDELDVASEQVKDGNSVTVTFTVPEGASGQEYEFYCSVGSHRELGMVGTLMVK